MRAVGVDENYDVFVSYMFYNGSYAGTFAFPGSNNDFGVNFSRNVPCVIF